MYLFTIFIDTAMIDIFDRRDQVLLYTKHVSTYMNE